VGVADLRTDFVEIVGAGKWREDREADVVEFVFGEEIPEAAEVILVPRRITNEIAGDADADLAADGDRLLDLGNAGILLHARESGVGRRFETKEDVDLLRESAPLLHQRRLSGHEVGP